MDNPAIVSTLVHGYHIKTDTKAGKIVVLNVREIHLSKPKPSYIEFIEVTDGVALTNAPSSCQTQQELASF